MRCSLLLLSTYVDGELNQRRAGELEAHLVGCTRCQAGLGYLREESQRISGLAHVHVPDHSAHALLIHVGLITEADDLPGDIPPAPPLRRDAHAPPWVAAEQGRALPWTPPERHAAPPPPPPHQVQPVPSYSPVATLDKPPVLSAAEDATAQLEVPGIAVPSTDRGYVEEEQFDARELEGMPQDPIPAAPLPPKRASSSGAPDLLRRMRDAVGVRWALMRGGPMDDDSIGVVTAPHRPRATGAPAAPAIPALPAVPAPHEVAPARQAEHAPISPTAPAPRPTAAPRVAPARVAPPQRGRHLRGLSRPGGLRVIAPDVAGDRRLWAFGAVTLALLVVGLVLGRHVETLKPVARAPGASAAATPHASAAPVQPATPSPTVAIGPDPAHLTSPQTLGAGGRDYAVSSIRYGAHPGDFRIVYDLGPIAGATPAGTPTVTLGFGDATTVYIIFAGVSPGATPPQPARGGVVTNVSLLQHSPIAGHIVYQLTLSKAAKLSAYYLTGPARLVIDLR